MSAPSLTKPSFSQPREQILAGGWHLYRFAVRRDWLRTVVWSSALGLITAGTLQTLGETYGDPDTAAALEATMANPAMVAITGRNYAPGEYTVGVIMGQQMLVWTLLAVAIMSILLMVRHTRTEEATGRAELIRANPVGRHAVSLAAFKSVATSNLIVAVVLAGVMGTSEVATVDWAGSVLYGAAHLAVGLAFAAIALVAAQFSEYPRGAVGLGMAALAVAFVMRGIGDVGDGIASWLSPFGWGQATQVYHADRWWPLGIAVLFAGAVGMLGMRLSSMRDVGSGLRAARSASPHASDALSNPFGMALRLSRGLIVGWTAGAFLLGASYGSIMGDVESFLSQIGELGEVFAAAPGVEPAHAFAGTIMVVVAVISASASVLAAQKLRAEESEGRLEAMFAAGLGRPVAIAAYATMGAVLAVVVLGAAGLGFGVAAMSATSEESWLGTGLVAALSYVPVLWVLTALGLALVGWVPKATAWTWSFIAYSWLTVYLGPLLGLPAWMEKLTPFGYVPRYPAEPAEPGVMVSLTVVALALVILAAVGLIRRDVKSVA